MLNLLLKLHIKWSNFLNRKDNLKCEESDPLNRGTFKLSLQTIANHLYSKFIYQYDDIKVLFDCMRTPDRCYYEYQNGYLIDDCDGFHAALLHSVQKQGYPCGILTYIPKNDWAQAHSVLIVRNVSTYYIVDYKKVYTGVSIEKVLERLFEARGVTAAA